MKLPGKLSRGKRANSNAGAGSVDAKSEDVLRARARRRLIGAVALVLTGVVVFPLIFETQPRPVVSDMNLMIPSQASAPSVPARSTPTASPVAMAATSAPSAASAVAPGGVRKATPSDASVVARQPRAAPKARPAVTPPALTPSAAGSAARNGKVDGARQALAALEATTPDQISRAQAEAAIAPATSRTRYVVQAGAYADEQAAQSARHKIERAGFKTYAQVVDTKAGKRIRVRIGPFASHDHAARVLARVKALGMQAVVLTL